LSSLELIFFRKPSPLREALDLGVPVGLGSDIAGEYSIDIMNSMRRAVVVSRIRDGTRKLSNDERSLAVDWKDALYLATRGGVIVLPENSMSNTSSLVAFTCLFLAITRNPALLSFSIFIAIYITTEIIFSLSYFGGCTFSHTHCPLS
jgi:hypothetical protein